MKVLKQKTAKFQNVKLEAEIDRQIDDAEASSPKVEELSESNEDKELADATTGMKKEPADFTATKTELADKIDTLGRIIRVLEHEMAKNAAAFTRVNTHSRSGLLKRTPVHG